MARLQEFYQQEVVPGLAEKFKYKSPMQIPKLSKIILNMGLGEAIQNIKILESATGELAQISGQKPVVTRARQSIAAFKLRKGMPIGCMVTLRGNRMYEFFDKLVNVALPRVRDFSYLGPGEVANALLQERSSNSCAISRLLIFFVCSRNHSSSRSG